MEPTTPTPTPENPTPSENASIRSRFSSAPAWLKIIGTIICVGLALGIALWIGSKLYYQVPPPSSTPDQSSQVTNCREQDKEYCLPFDKALASATIHNVSSENGCQFLIVDPTNSTDTATLTSKSKAICAEFFQRGVSALQFPHAAKLPLSENQSGYTGVGVLTNDVPYLVTFSLFIPIGEEYTDKRYRIHIKNAVPLALKQVSGVQTILLDPSLAKDAELAMVSGSTATGSQAEEYFGQRSGRYSEGGFTYPVVKNSDGSYSSKVYSYNLDKKSSPAKVSFLVPYSPNARRQGVADRDYAMEEQIGVRPLYHQSGCGLEDSYGDMGFYAESTSIQINFGYYPTLYVTTAQAGYNTAQWAKVLFDIPFTTLVSNAQSKMAFKSSAKVEFENIAGYSVKHVGPITPERTCSNMAIENYDLYQVVKNGAVITFIAPHYKSTSSAMSQSEREHANVYTAKLIPQVLQSITYAPQ